jgi:hypothetical protein
MPVQRLEPEVKRYDLGPVRLWQDELAEIVRLIGLLPDVAMRIESDGYLLTDVKDDLPTLGPKVKYFTVKATRSHLPSETVISVTLSRDSCRIEETDPDLTTMGLIQSIKSLMEACRRWPNWLPSSFFAGMTSVPSPSFQLAVSTSFAPSPGAVSSDRKISTVQTSTAAGLGLMLMMVSLAGSIIFGTGVVQHLIHPHGKPWVKWLLSIGIAIPCIVLLLILIVGGVYSRSVLFTATREEAPTFWQQKRSDIAINVIVGFVFFLLGLLTAHL